MCLLPWPRVLGGDIRAVFRDTVTSLVLFHWRLWKLYRPLEGLYFLANYTASRPERRYSLNHRSENLKSHTFPATTFHLTFIYNL